MFLKEPEGDWNTNIQKSYLPPWNEQWEKFSRTWDWQENTFPSKWRYNTRVCSMCGLKMEITWGRGRCCPGECARKWERKQRYNVDGNISPRVLGANKSQKGQGEYPMEE
jgi:hypothetical protein